MLRALNDVLDRRYEDIAEGSDFARLVDTMSAGRDDSRLMQIVLDIRGRVQAHPNPAAWLAGAGLCPGGGRRPGGDPLGPPAAGRRGAAGGLLAGQDCPGPGAVPLRRQPGRQLRPQSLRHPGGPGRLCGGDAAGVGRGPGRPAHPLPDGWAQEDCGLPRRGGAGEGHPEHLQKADGEAGGVVRGLRGGSPGGSPGGAPGGAGAVRPGEGFRGGLCRREGPPGHGGLRRSGAHGGAPAGGGGRSSHRAGPPVVRPVRRDHGGRVPGHQRGAERHLHRPVSERHQPLPGGGCEAVHLPLPPG